MLFRSGLSLDSNQSKQPYTSGIRGIQMPVHRRIAKIVKKVIKGESKPKSDSVKRPVGGSWSGSRKPPTPTKKAVPVPTATPAATEVSWSGSRKPPGKGPPARSGLTQADIALEQAIAAHKKEGERIRKLKAQGIISGRRTIQ